MHLYHNHEKTMQAHIMRITDEISPDLLARLNLATDKPRLHSAMGLTVVSITKRAFNQPDLRATVWPVKSDKTPATLRKSGTLAKHIRLASATASYALVSSDRYYAAIHQLGGKTSPHVIRPKNKKALKTPFGLFTKINHPGSKIPARPFFPFDQLGNTTPTALAEIHSALLSALTPP